MRTEQITVGSYRISVGISVETLHKEAVIDCTVDVIIILCCHLVFFWFDTMRKVSLLSTCCLLGSSQGFVHIPKRHDDYGVGLGCRDRCVSLHLSANGDEGMSDDVVNGCSETCTLVDFEYFESLGGKEGSDEERRFTRSVDDALRYVPFFVLPTAYVTYGMVADVFDIIIDAISNKNWESVDGNAYEAKIIAPAINGIVVPAIAILFATLISNTVTTLRQRQLDIRTTLNMEAGEIRVLQAMVDSFPPGLAQDKCRSYLVQYTSRLIAESQPGVELNSLELSGSLDSEMNGFLSTLNQMNTECHLLGTDLPSSLLSETYGAVTRLNSERSTRISALQSTFPALHYVILSSLAASLCTVFLMETNQDLLTFLNAIQLKSTCLSFLDLMNCSILYIGVSH